MNPKNPLLEETALPEFGRILPEHVVPAVESILDQNRRALRNILAGNTRYSWDNLVVPLEEMDDRMNKSWSPVRHLHSVADNEKLREAYNACLPLLTDYSTDLMQDHDLYQAYQQIADGDEFGRLDYAQQKVVTNALREFRLSGVALDDAKKEEYRKVQQELSKLETKFEENLLDATHGWTKLITDEKQLAGLPESAIEQAARAAREKQQQGWLFTLDFPSYYPVMQYADDTDLRREMYTAYVTRASDQGPVKQWDNSAVMERILALRHAKAMLLGFATFAHYSLARKMAGSPDEVLGFLHDLAKRARPTALAEYRELCDFAREQSGVSELNAWDIAYYSEKLRRFRFDISQEELKPYFPANRVIDGLFSLVDRLYGLRITRADGVQTWHPDVLFYRILDSRGVHRGSFYLDLYAREHKRGGAWMDECITRRRFDDGRLQLPVAYLNCNFTPPLNGQPSLLTHDEVTTLFHEFGHGLQHMLTVIDYTPVAGINGVPWDAVELPSQIMENWCWERELIDVMAKHHQTGEPLPDSLFQKMLRAKNFQSGMQMVRQLEFALFDFRLHCESTPQGGAGIQTLLDEVRRETSVIIPPAFNRFQHSFSHIFAGGYAAGYYSYKWAEVLSADAFSKFEEEGIFSREIGEKFLHTFLEQGGARDPMDLFVEFRGRKPDVAALLRHSGIPAVPAGVAA